MQAHSAMSCMRWASWHHCTPFGVLLLLLLFSLVACASDTLEGWKLIVETLIIGVFPFTLGEYPHTCGLWSMLSSECGSCALWGVPMHPPSPHCLHTATLSPHWLHSVLSRVGPSLFVPAMPPFSTSFSPLHMTHNNNRKTSQKIYNTQPPTVNFELFHIWITFVLHPFFDNWQQKLATGTILHRNGHKYTHSPLYNFDNRDDSNQNIPCMSSGDGSSFF